jgi:tetratricopeptide (TPR) repeat protein
MPRKIAQALLSLLALDAAHCQEPDGRQVHWQRTLTDALELQAATGKPILVALNMDGESASDRIVHENYRDRAFVTASRSCICVVGSLFRHTPRDHDDEGRRIPCPRLGHVTCGEHIALEPQLFERFLADGERVAPRHALVLPDGTKPMDVSLSFDLREIDDALFDALGGVRLPRAVDTTGDSWSALAARRDHLGRLAFEDALAAAVPTSALDGLAAAAAFGDAGAIEALRRLAPRFPDLSTSFRGATLATAEQLGLAKDMAGALRTAFREVGAVPGRAERAGRAELLPALARLDGATASTRSLLLAALATCDLDGQVAASAATLTVLGPDWNTALDAVGGPFPLADLLSSTVARPGVGFAPIPKSIDPPLPAEEELLDQLTGLDEALAADPEDPTHQAEYAIASLRLARRRMESGGSDVPILLEDAELHFSRALDGTEPPADDAPIWWIERARAAYFLSRFEVQIECGMRALSASLGSDAWPTLEDAVAGLPEAAIEALRWVSDGHARLFGARSGGDPAIELRGIASAIGALGRVCASAQGDAKDWLTLGSLYGALGLWREELAATLGGALRFPASGELRQALNAAVWNLGRVELAPALADHIAASNPPSAENDWFSGYARILAAEDARRREDLQAATRLYRSARSAFARAESRNSGYADTCRYWTAMTWLGEGFAHVRAQDRDEAAYCLVEAARLDAPIREVRDGLGYDVLDLVDKTLEWRRTGPSSVEPVDLLERIDAAAGTGDAFWAIAVSDSALREALRADGRNPERRLRRTVDAAGEPIEMMMGIPNEEGDALLRASLVAARRAAERAASEADRIPLAQSSTIWAERMFERKLDDGAIEALAEASAALGLEPLAADAGPDEVRTRATDLRARLGEPRPRWRDGR